MAVNLFTTTVAQRSSPLQLNISLYKALEGSVKKIDHKRRVINGRSVNCSMELHAFRVLSLENKPPLAIAILQWSASFTVMFRSISCYNQVENS